MNGKTVHIPHDIKRANTFYKRLRGLMFRRTPLHNEGLWINPCNSIHMYFMNFAIDVVFLNEQQEVVRAFPNVKPREIIKPVKEAVSTLELPLGTIKNFQITLGTQLEFNGERKEANTQ
ncbi:DUF192 domain-containing protein [Thalassobacillus devorans]|uniref:DUF192 domain-containing protein n=1 Tax=Thalassobacillus devorans TaxID=279813 RepID=UPI0004BCF68B|nr:DUF192 domain-containing protein [Thalassobacillus devorans]